MKKFNLIKFKMVDLLPLLTSICVITEKLCQIARLSLLNKKFQVGIYRRNFNLIKFKMATFDLNIPNNWKTLPDI